MSSRLAVIAVVCLLVYNFPVPAANSVQKNQPVSVLQLGPDEITLNWKTPAINMLPVSDEPSAPVRISFLQSDISTDFGDYGIPFRSFHIGIPDDAKISYTLSDISYKVINNITLAPAVYASKDENGLSVAVQTAIPEGKTFKNRVTLTISPQEYFRDLPLVQVDFYPVEYDAAAHELKIIQSATIRFKFEGGRRATRPLLSRSENRDLYETKVLNYQQAKNWLISKSTPLKKPAATYDGPWFRINVGKVGLYRIDAATLQAAGVALQEIDPRTIQIFNHGGTPLSPNTMSLVDQPEGPVENAIFVSGQEDGSFGSADYILFYAKGAGGWTYSEYQKDFEYIQHPYDSKNYYWLTYGAATGKRMVTEQTPASGATVSETYFLEHTHFEDDLHNLLASGTDWYGYRFLGKTDDVSLNYTLNHVSKNPLPATFRIRFKGGAGLIYLDDDSYRYYFSTWINPDKVSAPVFSSKILREELALDLETEIISTDYLNEGRNTVYIQYSGNYENCKAYLDYMEFLYPRDLTAVNNQLMFYTNTLGQTVHYTVTGFNTEDVRLYDISDPVNVRILETGNTVQGGELNFNLDLTAGIPRRLIASTMSSSEITKVANLTRFEPRQNLMDPSNSSDLLVICDPSFVSYAQEIVDLRASGIRPLKGMVVTTEDIYFYFSSGIKDVLAIRNFIRYAYYNWSAPQPAYILLFGDGHYDYRNIVIADTNRIPPFEISANLQLDSRESDNFYVDLNHENDSFASISPDLAIGRLPVESEMDARRVVDKLKSYEVNRLKNGWQSMLTFVADDEMTSRSSNEWGHQRQTDAITQLPVLNKFLKRKIYLSAYESVPGGFGRVKPKANQAIIDQLNEGTLMINYVGHGSPTVWAHESALEMTRDLNRIQNENKLPLWIAATCDFGKYDDPHEPSLTEALVWQEGKGAIAVVSSSRLVYSFLNSQFNTAYINNLFPNGGASRRLGDALLLSMQSSPNYQKYHLFGDPSMYIADPRGKIQVTDISPDTLKALGKVSVSGTILTETGGAQDNSFEGGAFLIINDATYDSVNTGGPDYYTVSGPRIFKGEITVENGEFTGEFIVPKSIRYKDRPTGRATIYAWNEAEAGEAMGYVDTLLFNGTSDNISDKEGPEISIYFRDQEGFQDGDMINKQPVLLADLFDENGINLTQEVGHKIEMQIDDAPPVDISAFFAYQRDSYAQGSLSYHLDDIVAGEHTLSLQVWDNLNNPSTEIINFRVVDSDGLVLSDVVNYPNPMRDQTEFTFQLLGDLAMAEVRIKIYTITGRLIRTLDNLIPSGPGFNYFHWDGRDDDGDFIANGVYIYKVIVKNDREQKEVIEKLVILR